MTIGLSIGINAAAGLQNQLAGYTSPDGTPAGLVLDFTRGVYAADLDGSLLSYRSPDGTLPALVLDFETGNYGASL